MNTTPSQLISQSVGKTISHSVGSSVSNAVSSSANNIADTVLTADQASQPPTSSDASELSDQDNDQAGSEHKPGEGYQLMDASALTRIESIDAHRIQY